MRAAPAVSVRCTGGSGWRAWRALVPALAAAAVVAWAFGHAGQPGLGTAVSLGLAVVLLTWGWRRLAAPAIDLAWDGQHWTADGTAGSLSVMLDLGPWMLLRLDGAPPRPAARWVAVGRREAGAAWHLLRAAAFAQPPLARGAKRTGVEGAGHG